MMPSEIRLIASKPWAADLVNVRIGRLVPGRMHLRPRIEAPKLNHLSEFIEALQRIFDLGQFQADGIGLVDDLEEREAHGALKEKVVDVGHGEGTAVIQLENPRVARRWEATRNQRATIIDFVTVKRVSFWPNIFCYLKVLKFFAVKLGHGPCGVESCVLDIAP